jgi:15-cis-phytoene synthase/lycopene beta-cyclase
MMLCLRGCGGLTRASVHREAIFFIATNVLIVFGLIASDFSLAIHDAYPSLYPLKTSSSFPSLPQVLKSVTTSPNSYPQQHLTDLQDAIHTLAKASPSFHAASVTFEGKLRLDLLSL